jgi:hypothetical protein
MARRAIALVASVLVLSVAEHALCGDAPTSGRFINKAGTYKLADGKVWST